MAARHRLFACSVTAAVAGLSAPGCSYMDPYGHLKPQQGEDSVTALYPRLDRVPAAASQSASVALDGRLGFVGALPEQIQRTEARRGQLIALMNDMEDERTAYDAAVWTVAPWLVYRLVTPGYSDLNVQHQLVGGAASLAAWKTSLGGRTTDMPSLYGQSVLRLGCAITRSGRYLFTRPELNGTLWRGLPEDAEQKSPWPADPEWSGRLGQTRAADWRDLPRALDDLRDEELRVENAIRILPSGERRASCAVPGSADCHARSSLLDHGGVDRDAQARDLGQQWAAIDRYARGVRKDVDRLLVQIDHLAALDLSQATAMEMELLRGQLHAKDPGLESLSALVTSLSAQTQELAASAAASAASAADAAASAASAATGAATAQGKPRSPKAAAAYPVTSPQQMRFDLHGIVVFGTTRPSSAVLLGPPPQSPDDSRRAVAVLGPQLGDTARLDDLLARVRYEVERMQDLLADAREKASASDAALRAFGCPKPGAAVAVAPSPQTAGITSASVQTPLPATPTSLP
jgi:hypothetical protein